MDRALAWKHFLTDLKTCASEAHAQGPAARHWQLRQEHMEELLQTNLTPDQQCMVEEILDEQGLVCEEEAEACYRQGFADGIWLLQRMGVL